MPPGDEARRWLYGVARKVLANHLRGERRHSIKPAVMRDELAAAPAPLRDTPVAQAFGKLSDGDYDTTAPITAPGEMLHGVDLTHRTVARLQALFATRHITLAEYHRENDPNAKRGAFGGVQVTDLRAGQVPGSWHVIDVGSLSGNSVIVTVDPKRWDR